MKPSPTTIRPPFQMAAENVSPPEAPLVLEAGAKLTAEV